MQSLATQAFASWDEPIEMLYACHSKVKSFCRQLQLLPDYLAEHGVNQAVKCRKRISYITCCSHLKLHISLSRGMVSHSNIKIARI